MSYTPSVKLNVDDVAAEINKPILPDVVGSVNDAEVGVKSNPVPSAIKVFVKERWVVEESTDGLICILAVYPLKSTGFPLESLYSNNKSVVAPCSMVNKYLPAAIFLLLYY